MIKTIVVLLIALTAFTSCKSKKEFIDQTEKPTVLLETRDSLFASFQRTACFGYCPVFELTIYDNGYATFNGKRNTDLQGFYTGQINEVDMKAIIDTAEQINFFEMEAEYDGKITDIPSAISLINKGGRKQVLNRYQGPKELRSLEALFDRLVKETQWQEATPPTQKTIEKY